MFELYRRDGVGRRYVARAFDTFHDACAWAWANKRPVCFEVDYEEGKGEAADMFGADGEVWCIDRVRADNA